MRGDGLDLRSPQAHSALAASRTSHSQRDFAATLANSKRHLQLPSALPDTFDFSDLQPSVNGSAVYLNVSSPGGGLALDPSLPGIASDSVAMDASGSAVYQSAHEGGIASPLANKVELLLQRSSMRLVRSKRTIVEADGGMLVAVPSELDLSVKPSSPMAVPLSIQDRVARSRLSVAPLAIALPPLRIDQRRRKSSVTSQNSASESKSNALLRIRSHVQRPVAVNPRCDASVTSDLSSQHTPVDIANGTNAPAANPMHSGIGESHLDVLDGFIHALYMMVAIIPPAFADAEVETQFWNALSKKTVRRMVALELKNWVLMPLSSCLSTILSTLRW